MHRLFQTVSQGVFSETQQGSKALTETCIKTYRRPLQSVREGKLHIARKAYSRMTPFSLAMDCCFRLLFLPDTITEEDIVLFFVWLTLLSGLLWIAFVVFYRRR